MKVNNLNLPNPANLRVLKLRSCRIDDSFLTYLKDFVHLRTLNLRNNEINGEGFESLNGLKWLDNFNISENPLKAEEIIISSGKLLKFKLKGLKKVP